MLVHLEQPTPANGNDAHLLNSHKQWTLSMSDKLSSEHSNRLINESSPYLLQHAANPVDWYPWGPEALQLARERDHPILLSIGYSACHWCHVMEQESFEDAETARVMNEKFICIKVDREERPDLDRIYQLSHQMLTRRSGGWPLTVFLTPGGNTPLFAGTYFPKEPRYGMPAFIELLEQISAHHQKNRGQLDEHDIAFREALAGTDSNASQTRLTPELMTQAGNELALAYDKDHGGFGGAPKFPHPTHLEILLRLHHETSPRDDVTESSMPSAIDMLANSLVKMANGGIYDHLGGGFCRYSVDGGWQIPHFEKMLYDNAQLLPIYAETSCISGDHDSAAMRLLCEQTADWVVREMQSADGGYFSSIDADSEGEEGKFYAFSREQVRAQLDDAQWSVVQSHYGLDRSANFEGKWHLAVQKPIEQVAVELQRDAQHTARDLADARRKLFDYRERRIKPALDDKILTSWNGLMIRGMARAGFLLNQPQWIDSAQSAIDFMRTELWRDGRLQATSRNGKTHLNAYLDDYVFSIDGLLEFMAARWRDEDIHFAIELADVVCERFMDKANGGFYFTSDDHENLIHRSKPGADDAIPSGNGIAAKVLGRLGHLLGEARYLDAASATLDYLSGAMYQQASAYGAALCAVQEHLSESESIVIRYEDDNELRQWSDAVRETGSPASFVVAIPSSANSLPGVLAHRQPHSAVTAYVCRGFVCSLPMTDIESFRLALSDV